MASEAGGGWHQRPGGSKCHGLAERQNFRACNFIPDSKSAVREQVHGAVEIDSRSQLSRTVECRRCASVDMEFRHRCALRCGSLDRAGQDRSLDWVLVWDGVGPCIPSPLLPLRSIFLSGCGRGLLRLDSLG
jgi:hypothetical protein